MPLLSTLSDAFFQCFFIPAPTLTEGSLPSQAGRIFIVTGGYTGIGEELVKILYQKHGTVYVAGRPSEKARLALEEIRNSFPSSDGRLEFLELDLADLRTIKPAVEAFLRKEQRLDVLTCNAGIMTPPAGSVTVQGHELQVGTNSLGHYLLAHLLSPILTRTAASSPKSTVRVTWAASITTLASPPGGVALDPKTNAPIAHGIPGKDYAQSKGANCLLAAEYHRRHPDIVSVAWNPGNLWSELQRHQSLVERVISYGFMFPTKLGAYTELFAGWSDEVEGGRYVGPWGRFVTLRSDIEGNVEGARRLWEWCEQVTRKFC